jgi:hypothetical protein
VDFSGGGECWASGTNITQGMYSNIVHLVTNMLSKDAFDKATFDEGNILTNQNETLMK